MWPFTKDDPFEPTDDNILKAGAEFDNIRMAVGAARNAPAMRAQLPDLMIKREVAQLKLQQLSDRAKAAKAKLGPDAQAVLGLVPHLRKMIIKDDQGPPDDPLLSQR